jgi:hypothetical protein
VLQQSTEGVSSSGLDIETLEDAEETCVFETELKLVTVEVLIFDVS